MPFHRDAAMVLDRELNTRWPPATTTIQMENLKEIEYLVGELRMFALHDGDWSQLRGGEMLEPVYRRFETEWDQVNGR